MITFLENLKEYFKTGDIGVCPNCGGNIMLTVYKTPIRNNIEIRCTKCKKYDYFLGTYHEPDENTSSGTCISKIVRTGDKTKFQTKRP